MWPHRLPSRSPSDLLRPLTAAYKAPSVPKRNRGRFFSQKAAENRVQAIEWALEHAQPGDVIVLCGKGHETYQEVNHVKHHMDEREIVAAYLERET